MSAAGALRDAIRAALGADAGLTALIGAGRVHDGPPRNAAMPYVALDEMLGRDISGVDAPATEHRLTLRAWSRAGGKREALAMLERVRLVLHEQPLTLAGHRLVDLRLEATETRFAKDRVSVEAILRFRAVTEPA